MFGSTEVAILLGALLLMVFAGVHIAISLGMAAALGIYLMQGDIDVVHTFIANTAYEALRDYVFAVIPLFMLMGEFLAKCGAARDLFALTNRLAKKIPGRLAVATVMANAVFAFVTGVSIAAAAAFSRIAYPEMKRYGYDKRFGLGCIAGSACLGMLIPPSVLMIVWGVLTEQAIGKIFMAGIIPGFILVVFYCAYIIGAAYLKPEWVGGGARHAQVQSEVEISDAEFRALLISTGLVLLLVGLTLGGIWLGFFTPTEGAGVGAALALLLALCKGMRGKEIYQVILSVGRTSAPLLILLFCAQLYSRVLSMTGITGMVNDFFVGSGLGLFGVLAVMVLIWFILGMLIDSISIILLTVPVFAPVAGALGMDPLAFTILGILAIEAGLLTPPFGILAFTVKAALPQEATLADIFRGSMPYWICLLIVIVVIALFPQSATWLPNLGVTIAK
ncbi:MAG: TRAP transporter large permease subunit [Betaproteobacteria bacterium]|nr:TRAP transporter large permease subunit [Betaproteobacteria bacterium]